jgi:hypothetical protein
VLARSGWLDHHLLSVGLTLDHVHVLSAEAADADDAVEVADVAVIEDEVARWGVVAEVVDLGVIAGGNPVHRERSGQLADLLEAVKSRILRVRGSWAARSRAVGLLASWAVITWSPTVMRIVVTGSRSSVLG